MTLLDTYSVILLHEPNLFVNAKMNSGRLSIHSTLLIALLKLELELELELSGQREVIHILLEYTVPI